VSAVRRGRTQQGGRDETSQQDTLPMLSVTARTVTTRTVTRRTVSIDLDVPDAIAADGDVSEHPAGCPARSAEARTAAFPIGSINPGWHRVASRYVPRAAAQLAGMLTRAWPAEVISKRRSPVAATGVEAAYQGTWP